MLPIAYTGSAKTLTTTPNGEAPPRLWLQMNVTTFELHET